MRTPTPLPTRPIGVLALLGVAACAVEPETQTVVANHTITNTVVVTTPVTEPVPDDDLDPGHFEAPLQQLARVFGDDGAVGTSGALEDSMHLDEIRYRESDARLFYCSYTFGVIDASDPGDPEYLAQGWEWDLGSPVGRATGCLHVDWDDADPDIVYVTHRGNYDFQPHLSVVDLGSYVPDPEEPDEIALAPVQAPSLREPGVRYEGLDAANGLVYVALHDGGIGVFRRNRTTNEMVRVGESDLVDNAYDIQVVGTTAYVVDEQEGLVVLDVTDPQAITEIGRLAIGGVQRDVQITGDFAYVAAGPLGLVIVDVSDPAAPAIVSTTPMPGTATRVGARGDRAAVAAWNDVRVFDVTDRGAPALIGAARIEQDQNYDGDDVGRPDITARSFGADIYGDHLFAGNWNTPYVYRIHEDRKAPYAVLPEDVYYMGIGTVEVGATGTYTVDIENDGNAPLTVYDAWATNPAFTVSPPGAVIEPGGEAEFTITYTATTLEEEEAIVTFLSDDPSWPVRKGYVVGNAGGIGVGDPFPYTEATDVNTDAPWTSDQIAGSVTLVAYFATF
jgi:hypothetical protein